MVIRPIKVSVAERPYGTCRYEDSEFSALTELYVKTAHERDDSTTDVANGPIQQPETLRVPTVIAGRKMILSTTLRAFTPQLLWLYRLLEWVSCFGKLHGAKHDSGRQKAFGRADPKLRETTRRSAVSERRIDVSVSGQMTDFKGATVSTHSRLTSNTRKHRLPLLDRSMILKGALLSLVYTSA